MGKKLGMMAYICHYRGKHKIGRSQSRLAWAKKIKKNPRPYLQNNQNKKRTGGMAQVAEHQTSKCEAAFKP
jgi:hypothetical protein